MNLTTDRFLSKLLPPELKEEFKLSGIPLSELETREDWILLLNCFFFGSARHDYRPLTELLQGTQCSDLDLKASLIQIERLSSASRH